MSDREITCAACGHAFLFTEAEQAFYSEKGLASQPKRCRPCRQARKLERGRDEPRRPDRPPRGGPRGPSGDGYRGPSGGDYRGPGGGDYRSPGGGGYLGSDWQPRGRSRPPEAPPKERPTPKERSRPPKAPRPPRPQFDITCATCGTRAQVPFQPAEGRDVFCQPCYRARRSTARPEVEPIIEGGSGSGIVE